MTDSKKISAGVQELISRLRDEGVQAGQHEADQVIQEAQKRAVDIVAQARSEADEILAQARTEIQTERTATHEALKLAARDIVLELKDRLAGRFEETVKGLVSMEFKDRAFLKQMILAIVGRAAPDEARDHALEILLSDELFPSDAVEGTTLRDFIQDITGDMVQKGFEMKPSGSTRPGIRLRVVGEDVEIDLTDEAIAALLLKHLLPRYRAYVEGEH